MLKTIVAYNSSRCEDSNIVRSGHDYKGSHKYHCKDCGSYDTLNANQGTGRRCRHRSSRAIAAKS